MVPIGLPIDMSVEGGESLPDDTGIGLPIDPCGPYWAPYWYVCGGRGVLAGRHWNWGAYCLGTCVLIRFLNELTIPYQRYSSLGAFQLRSTTGLLQKQEKFPYYTYSLR